MRFRAVLSALLTASGTTTRLFFVGAHQVPQRRIKNFISGGEEAEGENAAAVSQGATWRNDSIRRRRLEYGFDCGCPSTCTEQTLNEFGGQHKCGSRIDFLVSSQGWGLTEACHKVAGLEFPAECGGCDPQSCPQEVTTPAPTASTCECTSCTAEVLATMACNHQDGCFSCGERLNWLMNDEFGPLLTENDACIRLASIDFPNGPCGPACNPKRCNTNVSPTNIPTGSPIKPPSDALTSNPTATPNFAPVSATLTGTPTDSPTVSPIEDGPNPCSCVSCTQDVLNTYAQEFTCGARIDWLQTSDGGSLSELESCIRIARDEYPQLCGLCDPSTCNSDRKINT